MGRAALRGCYRRGRLAIWSTLPDFVVFLPGDSVDRAVPITSALLFDLGVLRLVFGATVLMLIAIAHQSLRSHRMPAEREPRVPAATPPAEGP